jgi:hypothetical protein
VKLPTDQRLLLLPTPAFDLSLRSDRIAQTLKLLMKDEFHRPARRGVPNINAIVMLSDAVLQVCAGNADVIGPVGAKQDVEKGTQVMGFRLELALYVLRDARWGAPQDEGVCTLHR